MSLYSTLAEQLQYLSPAFYRKRFFKKLNGLSAQNILQRKVEPELFWITKFLNTDAVFMDIGANVGAYVYQALKKIPDENIYAFEPNKILNQRLHRIFPNINISEIALSDENSEKEFKIPVIKGKKVHTRGTLRADQKEADEENAIIQKITVETLDFWAEKNSLKKLDFIKMDVEGNEIKTVLGGKKTIQKMRPVLMIEMEQRHHTEPVWNFISEIESWNYSANFLNRETLNLTQLSKDLFENQNSEDVKNYSRYINNIIFIPGK